MGRRRRRSPTRRDLLALREMANATRRTSREVPTRHYRTLPAPGLRRRCSATGATNETWRRCLEACRSSKSFRVHARAISTPGKQDRRRHVARRLPSADETSSTTRRRPTAPRALPEGERRGSCRFLHPTSFETVVRATWHPASTDRRCPTPIAYACRPPARQRREHVLLARLFRKTPVCRNVATRGVFAHNGVFHPLEQAIRWYNTT